ncbi:MAG: CoA transferase [Pseudomonadota bacterium]
MNENRSTKTGPLAGLRIIDLTHVMAGPVCTLLLADMGADVIKIERPHGGDDSRHMSPPTIGDQSAAFLMMNRNKRGLALNLKTEGGRQVLRRLIKTADILVENFRPGALDKLGLGYGELTAIKPDLIWCSISGFGRTGPYAERPGFDLMAQAMSGIMSFTGEGPGRPPVKVGAPIADITAGILAALGIVSALHHRQQTGEGQQVDTSLFEAAILHTFWQSAMTFATGEAPAPMGSAHPLDGPYQAFETSDGWVAVGAANQNSWLKYAAAIGAAHLADDPRFATNPDRMRHLDELIDLLSPIMRKHTTQHWLDRLGAAGVPVAPVLNVAQMHQDPQARARGMIAEVMHSTLGAVQTLGSPVKFSRAPTTLGAGAPTLGEHSREVLLENRFSAEEIAALVAEGAVEISDTKGGDEKLQGHG